MLLPRERLLDTLSRDLIGPQKAEDEVVSDHPLDLYITGILYPRDSTLPPEEDDDRESAGDEESDTGPGIPSSILTRPNVMGLSFALQGELPRIRVSATMGLYSREGGPESPSPPGAQASIPSSQASTQPTLKSWRRRPLRSDLVFEVSEQLDEYDGGDGLMWYVRGLKSADDWQITVALVNNNQPGPGREAATPVTFFQVGFEIRAESGCRIVPRRPVRASVDEEALSHEVIYRHAREWAVGHTCAAEWREEQGQRVISTSWLPRQQVVAVNPEGHPCFGIECTRRSGNPTAAFNAHTLAEATSERLIGLLETVPAAYQTWLSERKQELETLRASEELSEAALNRAGAHLESADIVSKRMQAGIALLKTDAVARRAFQLAQKAMVLQRQWSTSSQAGTAQMVWRPFQLGFLLLSLASIAQPGTSQAINPDRRSMDLLWFPTGGGKTEAYLGLIAFTLFQRRLRQPNSADNGAGVAVLMRYTLRLLTVQQFERASRLILACEYLRRQEKASGQLTLGDSPFSIGLWVGSGATPNTVADARTPEGKKRARQLARCPACNSANSLQWDYDSRGAKFLVRCSNKGCPLFDARAPLPIYTIDEEIYHESPSLLIGTIDKFAQITRNPSTRRLLGGGPILPPELIIQDELHLISGPLGSMAGLYEAAIDLICTRDGIPPKIIGSTATIRQADDQVRQLFNRTVTQFPPPVLDARDSCFAVEDLDAPGRLYAGVSTAGRSAKFILQAVCASLMQAVSEPILTDSERDPYWTLVTYFNALRELGGALVMLQDDVLDSMANYARLHGQPVRKLDEEPMELTSRVDQANIPQYLMDLERRFPDQPCATVLATNMISVGVDIPRLGLMVVNGQPKGMSEYIQATSRVGRNRVPGLVLTVYNVARPRDRSHFEAFCTWHQTLYREVEATSVTPFAPRARDRALHAAIVALARHRVSGLHERPGLSATGRATLEQLIDELIERIQAVDSEEVQGSRLDSASFLDQWQGLGSQLVDYWSDYKPAGSLLVSAEQVATVKASTGRWIFPARATPNSMREVEAGVKFRMTPVLKPREEAGNG